MLDFLVLPGFVLAIIVFLLPPGPDMAYMIAVGLEGGKKAAVKAILGIGAGMSVYAAAFGLGAGTLLQAFPLVLDFLKLCGAAYLIWLSFVTFRHSRAAVSSTDAFGTHWFFRGATVSLTNPKILIFFAAVLPQFIGRAENLSAQMFFLGLVDAIVEVLLYGAIGILAGGASAKLVNNSKASFWLNIIAAIVYLLIAIFIVFELLFFDN